MNQSSPESILLEAMLFNMEGKSPSAAIEAQEASGQRELAADGLLPSMLKSMTPYELTSSTCRHISR
jgi:hypothetical protein